MIESTIIDFLNDNNVNAFGEEPEENINEYVVVEKTSDTITNHISHCTIDILIYSSSMYKTSLLGEKIKRLMVYELPKLKEISKVEINSLYNFTDTNKNKYRYFADFFITYY